eukprot:9484653-Pyramimonas_sp.AAC.1
MLVSFWGHRWVLGALLGRRGGTLSYTLCRFGLPGPSSSASWGRPVSLLGPAGRRVASYCYPGASDSGQG